MHDISAVHLLNHSQGANLQTTHSLIHLINNASSNDKASSLCQVSLLSNTWDQAKHQKDKTTYGASSREKQLSQANKCIGCKIMKTSRKMNKKKQEAKICYGDGKKGSSHGNDLKCFEMEEAI